MLSLHKFLWNHLTRTPEDVILNTGYLLPPQSIGLFNWGKVLRSIFKWQAQIPILKLCNFTSHLLQKRNFLFVQNSKLRLRNTRTYRLKFDGDNSFQKDHFEKRAKLAEIRVGLFHPMSNNFIKSN